jgi:IS30 family transposase
MGKEYNGLSDKQEMAIELVVCGMSDRDIAEQTGKSRQTINRWRNHDPDFRAVLAERRKATRERHRDELSGLVSEAIEVMRDVMREGDMSTRLRAAQAVLRMSGLQAAMQTENPRSEEEIINEYFSELLEKAAQEMGLCDPKRLPSGE